MSEGLEREEFYLAIILDGGKSPPPVVVVILFFPSLTSLYSLPPADCLPPSHLLPSRTCRGRYPHRAPGLGKAPPAIGTVTYSSPILSALGPIPNPASAPSLSSPSLPPNPSFHNSFA